MGLVYLMFMCFEKVAIFKPNTSRPANSERYLVCKWKKPNVSSVHDYMMSINAQLNSYGMNTLGESNADVDIIGIVADEILESEKEFLEYMIESNNNLGKGLFMIHLEQPCRFLKVSLSAILV